jgi:hypothetical protein
LGFRGVPVSAQMLGTNPYGFQLRGAMRVLQGFDSVFGRESAHDKRQLTIGCHVDWCRVDPLHVLRSAGTAAVHSHNKFDVCHNLCP